MKNILSIIGAVLAATALSQSAQAKVVADFQADFHPKRPSAGWVYQWNPTGVEIGNSAQYADLDAKGTWCVQVDSSVTYTDKSLGNGRWLHITNKGEWTPGLGKKNSASDDLNHYGIAGYTIQPEQAGTAVIKGSSLKGLKDWTSGELRIYVNDTEVHSVNVKGTEEISFDVPLGEVKAGDTVYVAYGPKNNSVGVSVQFQIDVQQP